MSRPCRFTRSRIARVAGWVHDQGMTITGIMLRMDANRERRRVINDRLARVDQELGSVLDTKDRPAPDTKGRDNNT